MASGPTKHLSSEEELPTQAALYMTASSSVESTDIPTMEMCSSAGSDHDLEIRQPLKKRRHDWVKFHGPPTLGAHAATEAVDGQPANDEPLPKKFAHADTGQGDPSDVDHMYNNVARNMMARMGWEKGKGLGKEKQGRVSIVEASMQRGRRGLGNRIDGLEPSNSVMWQDEEITTDERVEWLPSCTEAFPTQEALVEWIKEGEVGKSMQHAQAS
ncbi:PREDICTED: cap-specific mRNA (nucleoside-2'-O-)-methyltransferase 1-like isoform X2 [Priapulus caudatus]|uniref:Cap-specific mRNA (Nucleoside-2'-O-)-methyltransferase 1-like isoform X2 n=1 Tax=Priapulus caudatus TaxID=37621 RepID=A0ABM1F815_PRICU|nr:PREDICTED: cap-specific mRNA (nucleoside-2'-O-)-methyltransferase 1-like isoform X2 [Priapulus caudatus]